MTVLIDAAWCKEHGAYPLDGRLNELFDHPHTLQEVLTRRDGLWAGVRYYDRIWALTRPRVLNDSQLREWLARLVERALARIPGADPSSVAVIAALRHPDPDCIPLELVLGPECAYFSDPSDDARRAPGAAWMAVAGAATFIASLNTSPATAAAYTAEFEMYAAAHGCAPVSACAAASEFSAQITDALEILE